MKWNENGEFWNKLDNLMKNCKEDLTEMLSELYKHQEELGLLGEAVMFGGIGKLVLMYNQFRNSNEPEQSLAMAFKEMNSDRRIQNLMGQAVNNAIDMKVQNMKGEQ